MAIISKPLSISPSCYELGHCWTPHCWKANRDVAADVFKEAVKIYGTLYLVAGILRKRGFRYYLKKFIPETLRSSIFLTINGTLFISMFCFWRRLFGFYLFYNVYICGIPACIVSILIEQKTRNMLGSLFFLTASFIPAYIAAFTAVIFERKSRRGPLAVYLTNLAIETGYRMLVERKLVTPVPNGEVYLFSAVSAVYLYLFRKQNGLSQASASLFRFFVGSDESPSRPSAAASSQRSVRGSQGEFSVHHESDHNSQTLSQSTSSTPSSSSERTSDSEEQTLSSQGTSDTSSSTEHTNGESQATTSAGLPSSSSSSPTSSSTSSASPSSARTQSKGSILTATKVLAQQILQRVPILAHCLHDAQGVYRTLLKSLEGLARHKCCPHNHSCLSYVLKGGARMFTFGYMVQAAISTATVLTSILKKPSLLKSTLFSRINLKLAAFLGGYSAIFRAVNCLLRWIRNKDSEFHGCVAGALAGLSLRFYRSITITLYAATKLVEILYFKGIESYGFPYIKCADIFIYAFSTAFIFHAAVMEPHTLRPGYWKFLLRVTNNKFAMMNRHLLDVFGVNSSKIQPNYWPDYDPAFTSLARPRS